MLQWMMMVQYRAMVKYSAEEYRRDSERNLLQCPFIHHESHGKYRRIEPAPPQGLIASAMAGPLMCVINARVEISDDSLRAGR
jgi:hypothetical protein